METTERERRENDKKVNGISADSQSSSVTLPCQAKRLPLRSVENSPGKKEEIGD